MVGPIEKFRHFLLSVNQTIPDRFRIIDTARIRNLSSRVLAATLAVLLVFSTGVVAVPILDADGDGLSNGTEWAADVDWQSADTDGDGLDDNRELPVAEFNATNPDTDGEGLNDSAEATIGSNASRVDTDQDGLDDQTEATAGTDPTTVDTDGDSLSDPVELNGRTAAVRADTDGDGLDDGKEIRIGSNATNTDTDLDFLSDNQEWERNTSLTSWDTDNDSLSDLREVMAENLNPRTADTDSDGIHDPRELQMVTLVNVSDTDDDGLDDGAELENGTALLRADTDNDTLQDGPEVLRYHSNPLTNDTDFDNVTDPIEVNYGVLNVTNPDGDGDGLYDGSEWYGKTNVTLPDTDDDGLDDWNETKTLPTDPVDNDTDADGLLDGNETYRFATEPLDPDTDSDTLSDGAEKRVYRTNATDPDTDQDALADGEEVNTYGTDPREPDTDGDGLGDSQEVTVYGTNATSADTDGDGIPDGTEVAVKDYNPTEPNPLHNKRSNLALSESQAATLGDLIDTLVRVAHSVATDDPNAGVLREYSQAIMALPDAEFTGAKATVLANFKQAGLYQILDIVQANFGVNVPSAALQGRLQQAISIGARMNSVLAVVSDYATLREQAEQLVAGNNSTTGAAKIGVITATAVLLIDVYLLYQTGGTFALAPGHKLAFGATGKIAAKTKLARLAKYCGWKCIGGIERLLHWSLRSAIDIGETQLVGAIIQIGYFNVTGISIVNLLDGLSTKQLKELTGLLEGIVSEDVLLALKDAIRELIDRKTDDWLSRDQPRPIRTNGPASRSIA